MKIKETTVNFNWKNISHQAGSISLDKYLEKIDLENGLKATFDKESAPSKRGPKGKYSWWELAFQMIRGYMQWYANPTELSRTVNDPLNMNISWIEIASQPTFSRFEKSFWETTLLKLKETQKSLVIKFLKSLVEKNGWKKLEKIDISDDSTKIPTYGKQEWSAFISHYNLVWYHPDLVTEDSMRLIMEGVLRDGNVYSSNGSELQIQEVVDLVKPYVEKVIFRADSAYGKPEIFEILNTEWVEFEAYIKAKTYSWWLLNCETRVPFNWINFLILDLPREFFEEQGEDWKIKLVARYFTIRHQAKSRDNPEIIVCKIKRKESEKLSLFASVDKDVEMLIVRWKLRWKAAFEEYGKRGKEEQIIEEFKNEMFAKNLSHTKKVENACELYMKIIAYNLMQILRLETLYGTKYAKSRVNTIRMIAFRIGGKIVKHAKKITIKLAETFPFQKRFKIIMERIPRIKFSLS